MSTVIVPLVWWLAMATSYHHYGMAFAILPVPFTSYADCVTAGKELPGDAIYSCIQQRADDVKRFVQGNYYTEPKPQ